MIDAAFARIEAVEGAVAFDVDGDGAQELLTWGVGGLKAWSAAGGSSPVYAALLPSLSPVDDALVTDLDQDGDEDLALRSEGELWLALANGAAAHPERYAGVRLEFIDGALPQDSQNVRVLIDEDGDFNFERVTLTRPLGDAGVHPETCVPRQ